MKLYVNASAAPGGDGSQARPFNTIQAAADIAVAGDDVLVMPGVYRENVSPKHGGTERNRIVYRSVEPRKAVIAGAEPLKGWHNESGNVWSVRVSNAVFTERNPYTTRISGDWFIADFVAHTGDVYMNGKSLYEVTSLDAVRNPQPYPNSWDSEYSIHVWYAEQDAQTDETVFYANFQGKDPNGRVRATATRHGVTLADVSVKLDGAYNNQAATACYQGAEDGGKSGGMSFYMHPLMEPDAEGLPTFARVNVYSNVAEYSYRIWTPGKVTVRLQSSTDDPWGQLPVLENMGGAYSENDLEMKALVKVAEADPKQAIPKLLTSRFDRLGLIGGVR